MLRRDARNVPRHLRTRSTILRLRVLTCCADRMPVALPVDSNGPWSGVQSVCATDRRRQEFSVSRSAWLLLITVNWSVLFAQTAPDLVVKVIRAGGHTRLILRNMHNVPIQAYAIDYSSGHRPLRSQSLMFNPLGTNPIAPNATMDNYLLDVPAQ